MCELISRFSNFALASNIAPKSRAERAGDFLLTPLRYALDEKKYFYNNATNERVVFITREQFEVEDREENECHFMRTVYKCIVFVLGLLPAIVGFAAKAISLIDAETKNNFRSWNAPQESIVNTSDTDFEVAKFLATRNIEDTLRHLKGCHLTEEQRYTVALNCASLNLLDTIKVIKEFNLSEEYLLKIWNNYIGVEQVQIIIHYLNEREEFPLHIPSHLLSLIKNCVLKNLKNGIKLMEGFNLTSKDHFEIAKFVIQGSDMFPDQALDFITKDAYLRGQNLSELQRYYVQTLVTNAADCAKICKYVKYEQCFALAKICAEKNMKGLVENIDIFHLSPEDKRKILRMAQISQMI